MDNPIPKCKLMDVEKSIPEWLAHRNKVLATVYTTAAPSDESEVSVVDDTTEEDVLAKEPARTSNISGSNDTTPLSPDSLDSSSFGPDDESVVLVSSDGSSGWSTPLEADLSNSGSQHDLDSESHKFPGIQQHSMDSNRLDESNYDVFEESQDLTSHSNGQQPNDNDYVEESYRTIETYETVTEHVDDGDDYEPLNSSSNPKRLLDTVAPPETDMAPERSSHSSASFWGNPVRFADPLREKEDSEYSSEEAITEDVDPHHREPVGSKIKTLYHPYSTTPHSYDEDYEIKALPDPPAAMDGKIHKDKYTTFINDSRHSKSIQNPWMPPSTHQREDTGNEKGASYQQAPRSNEEVLFMVNATIVETMERLTQGENDPHQFMDASSTPNSRDPSAVGNSKRIDFSGQTATAGYVKKAHSNDENSRGSDHSRLSTSLKIRKYYDNGRDANEEMRRLYMPTAVPMIANPRKEDEKLYDWVPRKYKGSQNDNDSHGSIGRSARYDADDENYTNNDDSNYDSNYESKDELNGESNYESNYDDNITRDSQDYDISLKGALSGTDYRSDSGYSSYDDRATRTTNKSSSVDLDIVDSDVDNPAKNRSVDGDTSAIHSDEEEGGIAATIDTTELEANNETVAKKAFPCHCLHICICLILLLVPGVVFGMRYYPELSAWFKNVFNIS